MARIRILLARNCDLSAMFESCYCSKPVTKLSDIVYNPYSVEYGSFMLQTITTYLEKSAFKECKENTQKKINISSLWLDAEKNITLI